MRTTYNDPPKTLGPRTADLVAELHARGRTIFTLADARDVTGLAEKATRALVAGLVERGLATRLKPGLFNLVPFELGHEREYLGNPFVVARELASTPDYYLSHLSAMDIHGMLTQPRFVVYVTSPVPRRSRTIMGTEFRMVRCQAAHVFGVEEHWITKTEKVRVSDRERTILDGLKQPEYCGGISEVAKGLYIHRDTVSAATLLEYAERLDIGVVTRRLGFLMDLFDVGTEDERERLHRRITAYYVRLDPLLPPGGRFLAKWRLQLNVSPEELEAIMRT